MGRPVVDVHARTIATSIVLRIRVPAVQIFKLALSIQAAGHMFTSHGGHPQAVALLLGLQMPDPSAIMILTAEVFMTVHAIARCGL